MTEGEIKLNVMTNLSRYMGKGGKGRRVKITCHKLADKAGIPFATMRSAKYRGEGGILTLIKIADALNVTINDLIYYRGEA